MTTLTNSNPKDFLQFKEQCEQIKTTCDTIEKYLTLRKDFSEETRLLLLVDKLQLLALVAVNIIDSGLKIPETNDDQTLKNLEKLKYDTKNILSKTSDIFIKELQSLCLNVHKISATLTSIDNKLNSVLEGPNYELGHKIMKECETDFEKLKSQI